ncbi:hypothetical protein [Actinomycetospora chiangmaiensis]|uniref:hypothetical protein n=1 Tax=Actinomycetospora chiangmaiensis TaxID=402650 RepID=UPI00036AE546|nr:hypothetical protein [Actinomycetospora chiangmaiensis]
MSPRWHLHARLFRGTLDAPVRNELRTAEGDDREALELLADDLRERGWRVWLYERHPARPGSLEVAGRQERSCVVREWRPL